MVTESVSVQLHTIEGVPREIPSLLVFAKCAKEQRRFPLCTRRAVTDAFFWKAAVLFRWQQTAAIEWLVYGFDGKTDIPIGRCRFKIDELLNTRKQAVESRKMKLIDDPSITICFSAEKMPRPMLPDGSVAVSVLKIPDFIKDVDANAPLFNHDRLYARSGASGVPSIWLGLAQPDAASRRQYPTTATPGQGTTQWSTTRATDVKPPYSDENNTHSLSTSPEDRVPVYNEAIRRPDTFSDRNIKDIKNKVKRKLGFIRKRGGRTEAIVYWGA
eukprot:Protomagalhaensia_sp_Gyna_25__3453@NODE_310_length_3959_cov_63_394898_g241_i0_p2_GENE_NODE_310_length_3959_cov_63_394898_g241_i0NODE_310_length_3959_cov_63_394898_g241_i0_p2_ORF_typecomplete_len272_score22_27_NODE_310_length_3959_cov_63_394898_g241_i025163331